MNCSPKAIIAFAEILQNQVVFIPTHVGINVGINRDMQQSLAAATSGGVQYGRILKHGNWEFIIHRPRGQGNYDAVIHAFMKK